MTVNRKYPLLHNTIFFNNFTNSILTFTGVYQLAYLFMLKNLVNKALYSAVVTADTYVIHVNPAFLLPINYFFRNNFNTRFDLLTDIAALDTLSGKSRFFVCYNYLSTFYNSRILIKVRVPDCDALQSITLIYPNSNWLEREAWDMFGIYFYNHPDLRRILTDYGFEAHPLRKDFPLTGYKEVKYSENRKMVVRCRVSLAQEYRTYQFNNPWRSGGRSFSTNFSKNLSNKVPVLTEFSYFKIIKKNGRAPNVFNTVPQTLNIKATPTIRGVPLIRDSRWRFWPFRGGVYANQSDAPVYFKEKHSFSTFARKYNSHNVNIPSFLINHTNLFTYLLSLFDFRFSLPLVKNGFFDISKFLNLRRMKYKMYSIYHKFKNFIMPIYFACALYYAEPWFRSHCKRQFYNNYILAIKQRIASILFRTRLYLVFFWYRQVSRFKTFCEIMVKKANAFFERRKKAILLTFAVFFCILCVHGLHILVASNLHMRYADELAPNRHTNMALYMLIHFITIFLMIAYYTLLERKVMASIQRRKGPNVNGLYGLLQPLADGGKLLLKEIIIPAGAVVPLFLGSPVLTLTIALSLWTLMPFSDVVVGANLTYSVLAFFIFSGLSIYGIIFAGWASNSKYPLMAALRSVAQMISYEVVLGFILLTIAMLTGSLNFFDIVNYQKESIWLIVPCFPLFIIYFIVVLAETNRAPFDLAEAEAELVAGYNTEYSGILFAMFFLAEYSNMIVLSAAGVILFFGGWDGPFYCPINFALKTLVIMILIVVVRAVLPRYRYDQLMSLGWRSLLPLTMAFFFFYANYFYHYDAFYCGSQYPVDFTEYRLSIEATC